MSSKRSRSAAARAPDDAVHDGQQASPPDAPQGGGGGRDVGVVRQWIRLRTEDEGAAAAPAREAEERRVVAGGEHAVDRPRPPEPGEVMAEQVVVGVAEAEAMAGEEQPLALGPLALLVRDLPSVVSVEVQTLR